MDDDGRLHSTQVDSLPTTGTNVPGAWVLRTRAGTRYVIAVPPEGYPRSVRIAYYGYDRGVWRPYIGSWVDGWPEKPVHVGTAAHIQFSQHHDDYYRSTPVEGIEEFGPLVATEPNAVADQAAADMRSHTARAVAEVVRSGRLSPGPELDAACTQLGIEAATVSAFLNPGPGHATD